MLRREESPAVKYVSALCFWRPFVFHISHSYFLSRQELDKHTKTANTTLDPLQILIDAQDMFRQVTQQRDRLASLSSSSTVIPEITRQGSTIERAIVNVHHDEELRWHAKRLRNDDARAYIFELDWVCLLHLGWKFFLMSLRLRDRLWQTRFAQT